MRSAEMKNRASVLLGKAIISMEKLPESGSNRKYIRVFCAEDSYIVTFNEDIAENKAFLTLSRHFFTHGLPVPEIIAEDPDGKLYIQSDLGSSSLYDIIFQNKQNPDTKAQLASIYKKVIDNLLRFQFVPDLDITMFHPRITFDKTGMMWDLNYFKYYFLKLAYIPFNEEALEEDFQAFSSHLAQVPSHYFMYRDFQSRNIMLKDGEPYFIDFQGGRRGALQYDLASLLFDAKADLSAEFRNEMVEYYCHKLEEQKLASSSLFKQYFDDFAIMRIMQAFGAYGYRGYYEKKPHFLQSVPFAANNLKSLIDKDEYRKSYPELMQVWLEICDKFTEQENLTQENDVLTINIDSISLKNHYPDIHPEHGGGFVFDCRSLPNPGRDKNLAKLSGLDKEVIEMLENEEAVGRFVRYCVELARDAIENYLERDFKYASFSFGCTGGRHRSVYCAEKFKTEMEYIFGDEIRTQIKHQELEHE